MRLAAARTQGHARTAGALLGAKLVDEFRISTHAEDRGDAVRSVELKLLLDILARVVFRILREIDRVAQMAVQIDDAGHYELTREVRDLGARRNFELRLRPGPLNAPIDDDHGSVGHGRAAGTVNECETIEYRGFGKCSPSREGEDSG